MVADVGAVTASVDKVNGALVAPVGILTLAGKVATAVLLLERETSAPPAGAGPLKATVPAEADLPFTLAGFNVIELSVGPETCGVTVSEAVRVSPEYDAEMVTDAEAVTASVDTGKGAVAIPDGTVTLTGTVATAVFPLESETTTPPLGAAPVNITVPVDSDPPFTLVGFRTREARLGGGGDCGVTVREAVRVTPA